MKLLSLALLAGLLLLSVGAFASPERERYDGHTVYRLNADTPDRFLKTLGLLQGPAFEGHADVWRAAFPEIDVRMPADEVNTQALLELLGDWNVTASRWIPDVQQLIDEVRSMGPVTGLEDDFFGDYRRVDQIRAKTVELCAAHRDCKFLPSIGKTAEGRDIFAVAFGGRQNGPAFYFQALQHAREHASGSTGMWLLKELLTTQDPTVLNWISRMHIVFVPVVNIDGYEYSHTTSRLWRKTRQAPPAGSTCVGIDANRAWRDHHGGGGSSGNPCSDTYHGGKPYAAVETAAVQNLLVNTLPQQGYNVIGGLDLHCYGQLILRPYGWTLPRSEVPPNNAELKALGDRMRDAIRAKHGVSYTSEHAAELYVAAGGFDDDMYTNFSKGKLGFTMELRDTGREGFLLNPRNIVPLGEEVWEGFKVMLKHVVDMYG